MRMEQAGAEGMVPIYVSFRDQVVIGSSFEATSV